MLSRIYVVMRDGGLRLTASGARMEPNRGVGRPLALSCHLGTCHSLDAWVSHP